MAARKTIEPADTACPHRRLRQSAAREPQLKSASLQYANALADIALTQGAAAPVVEQLGDFTTAYIDSSELRNFLESPAVTKEEKRGVADKISARLGASKILRNFLFVIIDHQRMHQLPEILETFQNVLRERQGIAEAGIFSAVALNDTEKTEMKQTLERVTGKKIEAKFSLDPNLLGGALVRVGDTIYDGSLRNRLNGLRERLLAE
ncbi:MAG: ATP synthase F1 subunit delta [Acidobacteria bacterium]|nr:MAG: ATP synthase F1 subunit delta [Acidobacteriota bacterium]